MGPNPEGLFGNDADNADNDEKDPWFPRTDIFTRHPALGEKKKRQTRSFK